MRENDTNDGLQWQGLSAAKLRAFADNPPPGHEHIAPIARGIADGGLAWLPVPQNRKDIKLDKLPPSRGLFSLATTSPKAMARKRFIPA